VRDVIRCVYFKIYQRAPSTYILPRNCLDFRVSLILPLLASNKMRTRNANSLQIHIANPGRITKPYMAGQHHMIFPMST
jgi:hypothetical protein